MFKLDKVINNVIIYLITVVSSGTLSILIGYI